MDEKDRFGVDDAGTEGNELALFRWKALVTTHGLFPRSEKECRDRFRRVPADGVFNNFSVQ